VVFCRKNSVGLEHPADLRQRRRGIVDLVQHVKQKGDVHAPAWPSRHRVSAKNLKVTKPAPSGGTFDPLDCERVDVHSNDPPLSADQTGGRE